MLGDVLGLEDQEIGKASSVKFATPSQGKQNNTTK